jgi:ABC-type enterochelin transport system permease subunit
LKLVGRVAQLVEQRPFKAWVAGSIPAALTIIFLCGVICGDGIRAIETILFVLQHPVDFREQFG